MKLELKLTELKGIGRLHQVGFSMDFDGKIYLQFCTQVPSGLPYIIIKEGRFAGKTFAVNGADMMEALELAFFRIHDFEPAAEPAPGDQLSPIQNP